MAEVGADVDAKSATKSEDKPQDKPQVKKLTDEEVMAEARRLGEKEGLHQAIKFLMEIVSARLNAGQYDRVCNLAVNTAWYVSKKENDATAFVFLENLADVLLEHEEKKAAGIMYDRCLVFLSGVSIGDLKPLMASMLAPRRDALHVKMQQCKQ